MEAIVLTCVKCGKQPEEKEGNMSSFCFTLDTAQHFLSDVIIPLYWSMLSALITCILLLESP